MTVVESGDPAAVAAAVGRMAATGVDVVVLGSSVVLAVGDDERMLLQQAPLERQTRLDDRHGVAATGSGTPANTS